MIVRLYLLRLKLLVSLEAGPLRLITLLVIRETVSSTWTHISLALLSLSTRLLRNVL
jgi:hypothetical protein